MGVNLFIKYNLTYKEKVTCKTYAEKLHMKSCVIVCDINICQKNLSYFLLEITCKMKTSSIEEHIISPCTPCYTT